MAYRRRKYVNRAGKRRYRRRLRAHRRRGYAPSINTGTPLGSRHACNLRYAQSFQFTPGTTAVDQTFRANSCFDPDLTGTGHQPYGFDQLMLFFDHYCVTGARIKVTFSGGPQCVYNGMVLLKSDASSLTGSTMDTLKEQNAGKICTVFPDSMVRTISKGFSARKFFTCKDPVGEDELNGSLTANPIEAAYFHVCAGGVGGQSATATWVQVVIDYHVVFSEPRTLLSS